MANTSNDTTSNAVSGANDNDVVFTINELAKRWKTSRNNLYKLIARGEIITFTVGSRGRRVRLAEVQRFEQQQATTKVA